MQRSIPWLWILLLAGLLLLPGSFGRLLVQLVGGITLALFALPLLAGGAAVIGWQLLKRRLRTCPSCGLTTLGTGDCPACGSPFAESENDPPSGLNSVDSQQFDASNVTINVDAVDVDEANLKSSADHQGSVNQ